MGRRAALFALLLNVLAIPVTPKVSKSKHIPPIILIPGDGGSQVEAKLNKPYTVHYICSRVTNYWFDLWLNMELLMPYVIDCWIDNMRLEYDNVTRTTQNSPGVEIRIPGFGNSSTVEWLDPSQRSPTGYFKDIVNALIPFGYERDVTVRGAPYDFRKAPNEHSEYFLKLRRLIEESYQYTGQRALLILHSMGAPMMRYFFSQQTQHWKDKHIETVVSLAGAWGGSMKAVKVYTSGDNLGVSLIRPDKVRTEQRSAPSLAFLLPTPELWGPDEVFLQTNTLNITTSNYKDMFDALNLPNAYEMYLDTRDLIRNSPAPGVEIHCLHGSGIETVEKMVYKATKDFPDYPEVINGDGDGTVNKRSAELCLKWKDQQKQEIFHVSFKDIDHMNILRNASSINYIVQLVKNITEKNHHRELSKMKNLLMLEKKKDFLAASNGNYEMAGTLSKANYEQLSVETEYTDNHEQLSVDTEYTDLEHPSKDGSLKHKEEDRRKNMIWPFEENPGQILVL